ncbi:MAG: hypothetical protein JWO35_71 [Candidatus Saccharibacteria bacterium]|nr:hypothetical protein [Candidatus Saccharibacteria bacterium]
MATYKLMQDIEAEDHILGPLSLRQFIFALIAVFNFYICFICVTKGVAFLLILFLPPGLFFGFFAMPFGKDQPTEVWALAKLRFWFKPRKRIWDQSGVKELVTITVPKKIERVLTNGLDQDQVQSRLKALASTIDSRGWAIKNVSVNAYVQATQFATVSSDRLIDPSTVPRAVPSYEVLPADDVLDEVNNPIARQFDQMITKSSQEHRQQLVNQLNAPAPQPTQQQAAAPADYWFMNQQDATSRANATINQPDLIPLPPMPSTTQPTVNPIAQAQDATADETAMAARFKAHNASQQASNSHLRTLQPLDAQPQTPVNISAAPAMTPQTDPAILNLANNNDLNVATLAREAYKVKNNDEPPQDEVVISLR